MTASFVEKPAVAKTESAPNTRRRKPKKKPPGKRFFLYIGFALGLVAVQSVWLLPLKSFNSQVPQAVVEKAAVPVIPPLVLDKSLDGLKAKLAQVSDIPKLHAGVFVTDQVTGRYVDLNGHEAFPAASMIKVPVFVALLSAIDAGKVKPEQEIVIRQDLITGGSGWLQWRPVGSKISVRDTADMMIKISDNTATNMLIDLLGGKEALNREFVSWGLTNTVINNMLGDFEGTNTTSPYDLVYLLARIDKGDLISPDSHKWMMNTMSHTHTRTLLPPGLGPGAKIAHKTGDIGIMVGDAGLVTMPSGGKYFVSVQVRRPHNDRRANLLIRSISKMVYQCFSQASADCSDVAVVPLETPAAAPHTGRRHHRHHRQS